MTKQKQLTTKNYPARAYNRIKAGAEKTAQFTKDLVAAFKEPSPSEYQPAPGSFEERAKGQYWCQIHAVNNALGQVNYVTMKEVEKCRLRYIKEQKAKGVVVKMTGGPKGFWDKGFFISNLPLHFGLHLQKVKLGMDGEHKEFLEAFEKKEKNWRNCSFIAYLVYHTKPRNPKDPPDEARHAVAIRDGHVLDADYPGKYFPLEDYPLRKKITAMYLVTRRP